MKLTKTRRLAGLPGVLGQAAILGLAAAAAAAACSPARPIPRSLVAAHRALERAQLGAARDQAPGPLAHAEEGFAEALAACGRHPDAPRCLDLSYVATRRAQQAEAEASLSLAHSQHHRAHLALAARRASLHGVGAPLVEAGEAGGEHAADAADLAVEEADLGASAVAGALEKVAPHVPVTALSPRTLVIQLPGPQAFLPGKSILLPSARRDLAQIALALQAQGAGHVQVSGSAADNDSQGLWRARTLAVVAYLIACGLPATHLVAQDAQPPEAELGTPSTTLGREASEVQLRWSPGTAEF